MDRERNKHRFARHTIYKNEKKYDLIEEINLYPDGSIHINTAYVDGKYFDSCFGIHCSSLQDVVDFIEKELNLK